MAGVEFPFALRSPPRKRAKAKPAQAAAAGLAVGEVRVQAPPPPAGLAVRRRGALCWVDRLTEPQRAELTLQARTSSLAAAEPESYPVYWERDGMVGVPRFYGLRAFPSALPPPPPPPPPLPGFPAFAGRLAAKQREAFDKALAALRSDEGGATLVLPCGFGKTVLALALCAALGRKALVLVHKECLLDQWAERIGQFLPGARVGKIRQTHVEATGLTLDQASADDLVTRIHGLGPKLAQRVVDGQPYGENPSEEALRRAGVRRPELAAELRRRFDGRDFHVVLGMLQSLSLKYYDPAVLATFELVVVDEAHHICAKMFSRAMRKVPAPRVLGLSATPERADGLGYCLPWFLGPVAFRAATTYQGVQVQVHRYTPAGGGVEMTTRAGKPNLAGMVTRLVRDEERQRRVRALVLAALREPAERYVMVLSERLELLALLEVQLAVLATMQPQPDGTVRVAAAGTGAAAADLQAAADLPAASRPAALAAALRQRLLRPPELAALWAWRQLLRMHVDGAVVRWLEPADPLCPAPTATIGRYVGGLTKEERQRSGACRVVLASYAMCSEGLDIPRLDTLVLATPRSQVEQSVGRILRLHPDKQPPVVHDLVDQYSVFAAMGWKRRHLYRRLGFEVGAS
jgi:hypothetical protein